ncbi:2-hydroxyacid dehydrogenase [Elusimicrobiota bacterium]
MPKFIKVLMIGYDEDVLGKDQWARIDKISDEKILIPGDSIEIEQYLATADCLLVKLGATVDRAMIDAAPHLKYIGMLGTGHGRVDAEYASGKGIAVCNIAGYSTDGVAEFAVAAILEHVRELARAKAQARQGNFSEATFEGFNLKGKRFGIVGLGRIGGRIAEIAADGFKANVKYWSRTRKAGHEKRGIEFCELDDLIGSSDFIALCMELAPGTEKSFNERLIGLIKPGAICINIAPMELVDMAALENRLKKRDMTFILDHSDELPPEEATRLAKHENCILYPPIAYTTEESTHAKLEMFVDNMENFLEGSPTNKVN